MFHIYLPVSVFWIPSFFKNAFHITCSLPPCKEWKFIHAFCRCMLWCLYCESKVPMFKIHDSSLLYSSKGQRFYIPETTISKADVKFLHKNWSMWVVYWTCWSEDMDWKTSCKLDWSFSVIAKPIYVGSVNSKSSH